MRLSFDLDDTLICYRSGIPNEPRLPWYKRLFGGDEPLRLGAQFLIRSLQDRGWEVWIYTTSRRSPRSIRLWLRCHGIKVDGVINQDIHEARLNRTSKGSPPSKNPAAFGIALHVDDSEGVRMEGEIHGYDVVVISLEDKNWTEKVLRAADEYQNAE